MRFITKKHQPIILIAYKNSAHVLELMKTASEYDIKNTLNHVYSVLLKYENIEINKKLQLETRHKPKK